MRPARSARSLAAATAAFIALAALVSCAQEDDTPTPVASGDDACASITTKQDGVVTIATSNPAFPPYVIKNDPTNGNGFESATSYAVAAEMGFDQDAVKWTFAPFGKLFAPGEKDFDFAINQIGISPGRERAVTFSQPYYEAANAVLVLKDSNFASATSLADLADAKIGVQSGTTGQTQVETVIQPTQDLAVYPNSVNATQALTNGQIDAFVTDLPTTIYLANVEIPGVVVGQLPGDEAADTWGLVLEKDNPLVTCVDQALQATKDSGELQSITDKWMTEYNDAPVLG